MKPSAIYTFPYMLTMLVIPKKKNKKITIKIEQVLCLATIKGPLFFNKYVSQNV